MVCTTLGKISALVYGPRFPQACGNRAGRVLQRAYLDLLSEADEFYNIQSGAASIGPTGGIIGPISSWSPAAPGGQALPATTPIAPAAPGTLGPPVAPPAPAAPGRLAPKASSEGARPPVTTPSPLKVGSTSEAVPRERER